MSRSLEGCTIDDLPGEAKDFARISNELMKDHSEHPSVLSVIQQAVETIPGCQDASITVRRRRHRLETAAATSDLAAACDNAQYATGEGPCVESVHEQKVHVSGDLRDDERWRRWGPKAAELGARSVLSIRLATDEDVIGALNMYSLECNAFDNGQIDLAQIFVIHASNALASARLVEGLRIGADGRHTVGMAQGILMQSFGISMNASFEVLRRYSSHLNLPIRDLANYVVDHGRLPRSLEEFRAAARPQPDAAD